MDIKLKVSHKKCIITGVNNVPLVVMGKIVLGKTAFKLSTKYSILSNAIVTIHGRFNNRNKIYKTGNSHN